MAAKKSASREKTSAKGQAKVHKVMHEYKHGQLKSGGEKESQEPQASGRDWAQRSAPVWGESCAEEEIGILEEIVRKKIFEQKVI
jgi:hypothetical protein